MLTPPTSYTAATGNFLTSALWNAQVRDANSFFSAPPSFRAYSAVTQSIPSGTWQSLNLEAELFDNYGGHSTSTNTSRYTCQVAGIYSVTGVATFDASSSTGNRAGRLMVNGTAVFGTLAKTNAVVSGSTCVVTSALIYLNVGDYLEVQANHNAGAPLPTAFSGPDVNPALSAIWVSN